MATAATTTIGTTIATTVVLEEGLAVVADALAETDEELIVEGARTVGVVWAAVVALTVCGEPVAVTDTTVA